MNGQLIQRGAELAADYVNAHPEIMPGDTLKLITYDDKGDVAAGVSGYRTLVQQDGAVAVTGFAHSSVNLAVNTAAESIGVPTLGVYTSAAQITESHNPVAFRANVIDPLRVAAWMKLFDKEGYKRIAVVAENSDYGVGLIQLMQTQVKSRSDMQLYTSTFNTDTVNLTPELLKVLDWKPDIVVNVGVGQTYDLMLQQATTVGLFPKTPMLISYDAPTASDFWQKHPDAVGLNFTSSYSPKAPRSQLGDWFVKAYTDKYGEAPLYSALNGFAGVMAFAQAIGMAGSTDPSKIVSTLETGSFDGWAAAPMTFPKADGINWHNWSPPVLVLQYTQKGQQWQDADIAIGPSN